MKTGNVICKFRIPIVAPHIEIRQCPDGYQVWSGGSAIAIKDKSLATTKLMVQEHFKRCLQERKANLSRQIAQIDAVLGKAENFQEDWIEHYRVVDTEVED